MESRPPERRQNRAADGESVGQDRRQVRGGPLTDHLVIDGVPGYDGRYEFDLVASAFTTREWGWIKKYSGYLPLTFTDGWKGADAELMSVFAIIALVRNKQDRP